MAAISCDTVFAREAFALANESLLTVPESITLKTIVGEKFARITG